MLGWRCWGPLLTPGTCLTAPHQLHAPGTQGGGGRMAHADVFPAKEIPSLGITKSMLTLEESFRLELIPLVALKIDQPLCT